MNQVVRTRFAPSPTGFLHIGGVRTALFNYLFAKQNKGIFILRLEDTDRERFVSESIEQIIEGLDWVALRPDEGFWISEGRHQNIEYVQSERQKTNLYQEHAEQLVEKGLAYYSPTSPDQLDKLREAERKERQPFRYRKSDDKNNTDRKLSATPIRLDIKAIVNKFPNLLNVGTPYPGVHWRDEVRDEFIIEDINGVEDFILIKGDGFPTYNFANVIDDHEMQITHVIRGDEFIASTGKHALLYNLFGWQHPKFVHLPVINGKDGKKLSKRTGDTNVLDYRSKGYLPEALINFLALLGWNDGTQQEIFSLDELVTKFKLEQINKSPAVFDPARLEWMNGYYIQQDPVDELYELVEAKSKKQKATGSFWPKSAENYPESYKKAVLGLVQERLKYFSELPELTNFFFEDLAVDLKLIGNNKNLSSLGREQQKDLLKLAVKRLSQSDFSERSLTDTLNGLLAETKQKPAVLFSLIRISTTWAPASPELAATLNVLGKERSLGRIEEAIAILNRQAQ